jgi:hypothetical protein
MTTMGNGGETREVHVGEDGGNDPVVLVGVLLGDAQKRGVK